MKCSENKKPVSLETIRYILKYLIHHEQVILYRQNNNARYYYALTSNDRAVEALRKQEEDYLPNKIVRYLHDNGSKHQALISENVIGDRRPTKYLIEILRKMRDEGIVVTQSVGSCIFYSLNQPYICDRRQVC